MCRDQCDVAFRGNRSALLMVNVPDVTRNRRKQGKTMGKKESIGGG